VILEYLAVHLDGHLVHVGIYFFQSMTNILECLASLEFPHARQALQPWSSQVHFKLFIWVELARKVITKLSVEFFDGCIATYVKAF